MQETHSTPVQTKRYKLRPVFLQGLGIVLMVAGFALIMTELLRKDTLVESTPDPQIVASEQVLAEKIEELEDDKDQGQIAEGLATTNNKVNAATMSAQTKAQANALQIAKSGRWLATDYVKGDIGVGSYQVQLGDTLWEISEAVYGRGQDWQRILAANPGEVGFLPNGSQALIIPGQTLNIVL